MTGRGFRWAGAGLAALCAAGSLTAVDAHPAPAVAASCVYLVKDLRETHGLYHGQLAVFRKTGDKLRGYVGAFNSDWAGARGTIKGKTVKLRVADALGNYGHATKYRWIPTESRMRGWQTTTKADLRKYSAGAVPLVDQVCA